MNALETALRSRLTSTAGLTALLSGTAAVYNRTAPQGAVLPYIVFRAQADDTETVDPHRREDAVYAVKALATSQTVAGLIEAQIDSALDNAPLTVSGYTNFWLRRMGGVTYEEAGPTGYIYHQGGLYRIRLSRS